MFLFLLGVIVSVLIYYKLIKPCSYWKEKGVKCGKAWPLLGSMGRAAFKREPFVDVAFNLYNQFPEERYVGYMQFMQQGLIIRDAHLVQQITTKDFNHFTDHVIFGRGFETDQLLNKSLLALKGDKWKDMRSALRPAFTSSQVKKMYRLMDKCALEFVNSFDGEAELEMRDVLSKFAGNVIASVAFGVEIDCLKEPTNEFFRLGVVLNQFTLWQTIKLIMQSSQTFTDFFQMKVFPARATTFFRSVIKDNIQKREAEGIVRPDLIHFLMEARKGKLKSEGGSNEESEGFAAAEESTVDHTTEDVEITDDHIVAQAMLFLSSGLSTVATAASFMAHELAVNPDIQTKLREEIDNVRNEHAGQVPYDALLSMKYLDQVVSETLRLWPPTFETDRVCVKNYLIEPNNPEGKGFLVQKGVVAVIPIMAIQRDPQYYPEPNRFDPDRFNDENKSKIKPGTYMPFGLGPRNCIGSRFALLEIKALFCHLLSKFEIVPIEKTAIPIRISAKSFDLVPEGDFWLGFKPRRASATK